MDWIVLSLIILGPSSGNEPVRVLDGVTVGDDCRGPVDVVHVAQGDPGLQAEVGHQLLQARAAEHSPQMINLVET